MVFTRKGGTAVLNLLTVLFDNIQLLFFNANPPFAMLSSAHKYSDEDYQENITQLSVFLTEVFK